MRRAVFLDRDGGLNENVFYTDTAAWEAPRTPVEFRLNAGVLPALAELARAGFLLFVVSNQPNEAKGKSLPGALHAMARLLAAACEEAGVRLEEQFYCTHHPAFTAPCVCRKPSPYFLEQAALQYGLSVEGSWMIGDRVTDMQCGRAAGTRTAWVRTGQEADEPEPGLVDVWSGNLPEAVEGVLRWAR